MTVTEAFSDVADIIARMDPAKIVGLKASTQMSNWVEVLVNKKKDNIITAEEANELERLLALDLFISLAKARAHVLLKTKSENPVKQTLKPRQAGWGKGFFAYVAPDFDETPPGFEDYMLTDSPKN